MHLPIHAKAIETKSAMRIRYFHTQQFDAIGCSPVI
jgi:hypothetical protein